LGREEKWRAARVGRQHYDVFLTVDRNLYFQQNRSTITIAVLVLAARTNRLVDLRQLAKDVLAELSVLKPGDVSVILKKST
jgi:hypothetical protein